MTTERNYDSYYGDEDTHSRGCSCDYCEQRYYESEDAHRYDFEDYEMQVMNGIFGEF